GSEHEKTLSTILGLVRPVADELLEKTCVLYRSDGALPFWIGDSPVTMHNTINPGDGLRSTLGFGVPGIEVYLPISSELVLAHLCTTISVASGTVDEQTCPIGFIQSHPRPYLQAPDYSTPILLSNQHVQILH